MLLAFLVAQAWETRTPEAAGLDREKLDAMRDLVGGRGCVVRHGALVYTWGDPARSSDVASAFKPVLSTLLMVAVQEGKLKSVDAKLSEVEPRLTGKNAGITWRHLASQTSGYGLAEPPGQAYSYNDYALALYYDTLMDKVFKEPGTEVLKSRLGKVLEFEDEHSFEAFGAKDRPGRLALSARDFARFGLLILRGGRWKGRAVIDPGLLRVSIASPLPAGTPPTEGGEGEMIPGQRTIGGTKTITKVGPGFYSFTWWLNREDAQGRRLWVDGPADAIVASGHGGQRALWILPALDLVVVWNESKVKDHDTSPGNPDALGNRAAKLLVDACRGTDLGIEGTSFTVDGQKRFLIGASYYAGLGASDATVRRDLDDLQRLGFNWIRVWATWAAFGNDVSVVDVEGRPRDAFLKKLAGLVAECDRRGMVVDVTLSRENGVTGGPRLQTMEAHRRAVEVVVSALKDRRNWYLDLSNERNIKDKRFASFAEIQELRELARTLDPRRRVTASHAGDLSKEDLKAYLGTGIDFIAPHRPRGAASAGQTREKSSQVLEWMKEAGRVVPLHYQEPFRRGFAKWNPGTEDFLADLEGAREGGAAGWCFHNGDERETPGGAPRRSFDLREKGLLESLDDPEKKFLREMR